MTSDEVRYDVRGHIAEVVIDSPAKRNALSVAVVAGLHAALESAESRRYFESPTAAEGRRAFRERRPPAWSV